MKPIECLRVIDRALQWAGTGHKDEGPAVIRAAAALRHLDTAVRQLLEDRREVPAHLRVPLSPEALSEADRIFTGATARNKARGRAEGLRAACKLVCDHCAEGLPLERDPQGGWTHYSPELDIDGEDCAAADIRSLIAQEAKETQR